MSVGANIKKRRYELKMSQQELADRMGYKTRSTIAKIESGENDVTQKKLEKFAGVLHTSVEQLMLGYGYSRPQTASAVHSGGRKNKNIAIILAGGKSGRNRQNIPSQFINVNGKPIIIYCMEVYQYHPSVDDIYVVCLKGWESIVEDYANQYGITKLKGLIPAGMSGIGSLKNAVDHIKEIYSDKDFLIIQEATRPMVSIETVSRLLQSAENVGSATVCHYMKDYVQFEVKDHRAKYVDRNSLVALQSPEAHRISLMKEVFERARTQNLELKESCCTMLLYNLGYSINFIESSTNNIKIVEEEDIATFAAMVNR